MSRLIVEAVSAEHKARDLVSLLLLYVSVSRVGDGSSVTGLDRSNFRVSTPYGSSLRLQVRGMKELRWEPDDAQLAGCYLISIDLFRADDVSRLLPIVEGEWYTFGVQVRIFDPRNPSVVTDQGQTVVHIQSLGR
jgi:hypothetical protein